MHGECPMTHPCSYNRYGLYNGGYRAMSRYRTPHSHTTRNAVINATRFIASTGLTARRVRDLGGVGGVWGSECGCQRWDAVTCALTSRAPNGTLSQQALERRTDAATPVGLASLAKATLGSSLLGWRTQYLIRFPKLFTNEWGASDNALAGWCWTKG